MFKNLKKGFKRQKYFTLPIYSSKNMVKISLKLIVLALINASNNVSFFQKQFLPEIK